MLAATRAVLACPDCRGALRGDGDTLVCEGCGRRFSVDAGVPRLLPSESLGATWEEKQALGESDYEDGPPDTALAERFGRFADVAGLVVDVGSGVEPRPAYLDDREGRTVVRVDPLVGEAQPNPLAYSRDLLGVPGLAGQPQEGGDDEPEGRIQAASWSIHDSSSKALAERLPRFSTS